jgi:hypothetical protein
MKNALLACGAAALERFPQNKPRAWTVRSSLHRSKPIMQAHEFGSGAVALNFVIWMTETLKLFREKSFEVISFFRSGHTFLCLETINSVPMRK